MAHQGAHPSSVLGLDLDAPEDGDVGRWLVASMLFAGRTQNASARAAFERLRGVGLATPGAIAHAGAAALLPHFEASEIPKPDVVAAVVARVCAALEQRFDGSVDRLAEGADGLEELAGTLSQLGAGFGKSAVLRFLTPLRERWSVAGDLPSTPAVSAAAADLGLIPDRDDAEGAPASIARWTRNDGEPGAVECDTPAPRDVEAALERLGRAACLREREDRCPLGERCPRKGVRTNGSI